MTGWQWALVVIIILVTALGIDPMGSMLERNFGPNADWWGINAFLLALIIVITISQKKKPGPDLH